MAAALTSKLVTALPMPRSLLFTVLQCFFAEDWQQFCLLDLSFGSLSFRQKLRQSHHITKSNHEKMGLMQRTCFGPQCMAVSSELKTRHFNFIVVDRHKLSISKQIESDQQMSPVSMNPFPRNLRSRVKESFRLPTPEKHRTQINLYSFAVASTEGHWESRALEKHSPVVQNTQT